MKNYANKELDDLEEHYIVEHVPTKEFCMEGTVLMNLWGGGKGSYDVRSESWTQDNLELTKKDIWSNVHDDGFGCESYASCDIQVYQIINTLTYPIENGKRNKPTEGIIHELVFDGYINHKDVK